MNHSTADLKKRVEELNRILVSATPLLLEGYSPAPGADLTRISRLGTLQKSSFRDLVTVYDRRVEDFLMAEFERSFPGELVLGEEAQVGKPMAETLRSCASPFWVLDPIDGTTNYSRSYPFFCTTAALVERQSSGEIKPLLGSVWNPVSSELFSASRGGGAWLGRKRLQVTKISEPKQALFTTGFASERAGSDSRSFDLFQKLTKLTLGVRRDGSAALDLAFVAAGRIDAYWEWGLSPWDIAAGICLVEEAGGEISNLAHQQVDLAKGEILASNGVLHKWLVNSIKG